MGILTDQDCAENESVRLKFFNKEVNYQMGASLIAQRSNALIIPVYAYKEAGKFCIEFFKAKDSQNASLEELTLYQAQSCEEMIKKRPWEYFFSIDALQVIMRKFTRMQNESKANKHYYHRKKC